MSKTTDSSCNGAIEKQFKQDKFISPLFDIIKKKAEGNGWPSKNSEWFGWLKFNYKLNPIGSM